MFKSYRLMENQLRSILPLKYHNYYIIFHIKIQYPAAVKPIFVLGVTSPLLF